MLKSSKFDTVYEPLVQKCAEYLVDLEKVYYYFLINLIFIIKMKIIKILFLLSHWKIILYL